MLQGEVPQDGGQRAFRWEGAPSPSSCAARTGLWEEAAARESPRLSRSIWRESWAGSANVRCVRHFP